MKMDTGTNDIISINSHNNDDDNNCNANLTNNNESTFPEIALWTTGFMHQTNETTYVYINNPQDMIDPFHSNQNFMMIVLTHAITFFVGIIGNSVVIATWARGGKIRSSTATFLVSLAFADLLLLIIFMPLETLGYFVITWDQNGHICKLSSFVELLSGMSSILNLVAVSIERFLVIVYPIHARRWCTVTKSRRSLVLIWFLAIVFAAPPVFNKSTYSMTYYNNETSITAYYCFEQSDNWAIYFSIYELLTLFVIPALLMIFCYSRVIQELWTSTRVITILTSTDTNAKCTKAESAIHSSSSKHNGCSLNANRSYLVRWSKKMPANTEHSNAMSSTSSSFSNFNLIKCKTNYCDSNSSIAFSNLNQNTSKLKKCMVLIPDQFCLTSAPNSSRFLQLSSSFRGLFSRFYRNRFASNHQNHYRCHTSTIVKNNSNISTMGFQPQNRRKCSLLSPISNSIEPEFQYDSSSCSHVTIEMNFGSSKSNSNLLKKCSRKLSNFNQTGIKERELQLSPTIPKIDSLTAPLTQPYPSLSGTVTDVRNTRRQLYCQVIKMLLFIVILFHVCWGPRLVFNVIKSTGIGQFDKFTYSARVYFYLLSFIHSALNPFVYGFMSSNFRQMMIQSCNNRHRCKNPQVTTPVDNSLADAMATTSDLNMDHAIKTSFTADNSLPINASISDIEPRSLMSMSVYNPAISYLNTNKSSSGSLDLIELPSTNKTFNDNRQVEREINQMVASI